MNFFILYLAYGLKKICSVVLFLQISSWFFNAFLNKFDLSISVNQVILRIVESQLFKAYANKDCVPRVLWLLSIALFFYQEKKIRQKIFHQSIPRRENKCVTMYWQKIFSQDYNRKKANVSQRKPKIFFCAICSKYAQFFLYSHYE